MKVLLCIIISTILLFSCSCSTKNNTSAGSVNSESFTPQITPKITGTQTPSSTPIPTHTPKPLYTIGSVSILEDDYIYLRSEKDIESEIIIGAVLGVDFTIIEQNEKWCKAIYHDEAGYIQTKYLEFRQEEEPAPQHKAYSVVPGPDGGLIDVRRYTDKIAIDLLFAQDENLLGYNVYGEDICMLQKKTLDKLLIAQEKFEEDGYTIIIYDAYRPYSVTVLLYEKYQDSKYVSSYGGSVHNRGAAMDMSLLDSKGRPVEMPSPMHTLNAYSNRSSIQMYQIAKWNMDYMEEVMLDSGFTSIRSEWWHFNDADYTQYRKTDYDLDQLLKVIYD